MYHDISGRIWWDARSLVTPDQMLRKLPHISSLNLDQNVWDLRFEIWSHLEFKYFKFKEWPFPAASFDYQASFAWHCSCARRTCSPQSSPCHHVLQAQKNSPKWGGVNPPGMAADPRGWVRERLRTTHAGRHQDSSNKSLEKNISNYWTKLDFNVHA